MISKRVLVSFLLVLFLAVPFASHAQTASDIQSQMITLLQQIIELQKQLILSLTNQISQLQQQISKLSQPVSTTITTPHICAIVNPPSCSTTLTVMRDSYNCVTGYQCATPVTTTTSQPMPTTASASCTYGGTPVQEGTKAVCGTNGSFAMNARYVCQSGQWVPEFGGAAYGPGLPGNVTTYGAYSCVL